MTRSQLSVLWVGIALAVAAALFPPCHSPQSMAFCGWHFLFSAGSSAQVSGVRLTLEWLIIALVCAGVIVTLRCGVRQTLPEGGPLASVPEFTEPSGTGVYATIKAARKVMAVLATGVLAALSLSIVTVTSLQGTVSRQQSKQQATEAYIRDIESRLKLSKGASGDVSSRVETVNSKVNGLSLTVSELQNKLDSMDRLRKVQGLRD